MRNSRAKVLVCLALLAVVLVLMCLPIRWLFFANLALLAASTAFSSRVRTMGSRLGRLLAWVPRIAGFLAILWDERANRS